MHFTQSNLEYVSVLSPEVRPTRLQHTNDIFGIPWLSDIILKLYTKDSLQLGLLASRSLTKSFSKISDNLDFSIEDSPAILRIGLKNGLSFACLIESHDPLLKYNRSLEKRPCSKKVNFTPFSVIY
jgi:hypothetical protein